MNILVMLVKDGSPFTAMKLAGFRFYRSSGRLPVKAVDVLLMIRLHWFRTQLNLAANQGQGFVLISNFSSCRTDQKRVINIAKMFNRIFHFFGDNWTPIKV